MARDPMMLLGTGTTTDRSLGAGMFFAAFTIGCVSFRWYALGHVSIEEGPNVASRTMTMTRPRALRL